MAFDANHRHADHDVDPLFLERWSPRAFTGERIEDETLRTIFEAARWAPSAFNLQPWRYVYAHRDGPDWRRFLEILIPYNQSWVETGVSVLAFAISDRFRRKPGAEPEPLYSHSFDAGAAWACLALQASRMGLAAHGMSGFHVDKAYADLGVPEDQYRIEAAIAIGRQTTPDVLPESFQAREVPSQRSPAVSFVFEGRFQG